MENKKGKGVMTLLIVIIVFLLILVILMATGIVSFKSVTSLDNQQTSENNNANESQAIGNQNTSNEDNTNNNPTSAKDDAISGDELSKFGKADYNIVKDVYTGDYSFKLGVDGRININFENYISNISNVKDIVLFSPSSLDSTLYILTLSGDIYKYDVANYKSGNYSATKIDKYSNIKQMLTYQTRKAHAGGCDYIIIIDSDGKYYELDSFCV